MRQEINEYIERLRDSFGYSEEELDAVKEFRENPEVVHVPWSQYRFMVENHLLNRTRKLKKIRNVYFYDDKLWYLCHYLKRYTYVAILHSEEFLEERSQEKERFRKEVEANRALKKAEKNKAKQLLNQKAVVEVKVVETVMENQSVAKPKRPRIKK